MNAQLLLARTILLTLLLVPAWSQTAENSEPELRPQKEAVSGGEIKIFDDLVIPEGEVRAGAVRVIGGHLTVAGRVTGRITVLGGDVDLLSTAVIEGTIATIGGRINRHPDAQVTGRILEVNRGKVSLSREENRELFGIDDDRAESLDRIDNGDYWRTRRVDRHRGTGGRRWDSRSKQPDFEVVDGVTIRYNRSEGLALYFPFSPNTGDIPGFKVHGYAGRAFGARKWFGRLGVGEYLWRGRMGLLLEGHSEARHDDGWRVSPTENTLGALFINSDWYDWYQAEGFGGSLVLALPNLFELKARYRNENHRIMDVVTNWSLLGQAGEFRPKYLIDEGRDANLQLRLAAGAPLSPFPGRFQGNFAYAQTQSMSGSDFDYLREDLSLAAFVPLHRRLGLTVSGRTGTITGSNYGLQHQVAVGGIGSVQGYAYKSLGTGNHYAIIQAAITLRDFDKFYSLMGHLGGVWDASAGLLTGEHLRASSQNNSAALGLAYGGESFRLEFFKPVTSGADWTIYLRILDQ